MKLLAGHKSSFNLIAILFSSLTFLIISSYMFIGVNGLVVIDDNTSNDDRLALIAFKNEITQDPFGILSSWNTKNNSLQFCQWRGVTCSRRHPSRVAVINLNSQRLVGSISPHIGNFSFLKDLLLKNNSLTGEIPHEIGHLLRLKQLDLSYNSLEGEIPDSIPHCSNLTYLDVAFNKLVGRIPNTLGQLTRLEKLNLGLNRLSGMIPPSLYNMSSLKFFSLTINNFMEVFF